MQKEKNAFEGFTNLYELSKTLRFELKPVGNTQKMLDDNKVFEEDKIKQEKYTKIKPYFDRLHREFVKESLQNSSLQFDNYLIALKEMKESKKETDKKIKDARIKALQDQEKKLRKEIADLFDQKAKEYSDKYPYLKKKDIGIFFEEGIFGLLKEKYGNEKETEVFENNKKSTIFDDWKRFTGYFLKFHETRKNFYKDDGTSTAIATRIIDHNLRKFCDNLQIFEKIKNKIDFSEIEKNYHISISNVFSLNYYNKCFLQDGIDKYNKILGGETIEKSGVKIKGFNELINEHRQSSGDKLPLMKSLDKQILSEKEKFIDEIENEQEFFAVLQEFYKKADEKINTLKNLINDFVKNNDAYDLNAIYISKEAFNTISNKWANDVYEFQKAIASELKIKEREGSFSFPSFLSIGTIKNALQKNLSNEALWKNRYYKDEKNEEGFLTGNEPIWEQFIQIFEHEFSWLFQKTINKKTKDEKEVGHNISKEAFNEMIKEKFSINPKSKIVIKDFADDALRVYQMGKYFAVEKKRAWNPENLELGYFYNNPNFGYQKFYDNAYDDIVKNYNHLRNYLTRKPWEDNKKWKLNFENPTLAGGFDKNKESSNFTVILRKEGKYYLGIMKKGYNKIFDDKNEEMIQEENAQGKYEKMVYKYFPSPSKMIPKCTTQLQEVKKHFANQLSDYNIFKKNDFINSVCVAKKIYELNNLYYYKDNIEKSFIPKNSEEKKLGVKKFQKEYYTISKDKTVFRQALNDWIDFCKQFLKSYKSTAIFDYSKLKNAEDYMSLDEFYQDINALTYSIIFQDISQKYIEEKNQKSELYLFEIHNKDWNLKDGKKKTGTKNLHTLYFENLFSSENEKNNFIFKLNGQAELFFRPKTDENKLEKKKDKKGNKVIDHKRYAKDKILFHCPITLNRAKNRSDFEFKQEINNFLANNPEINIIGVDRGEKHLAYYSVITQRGDILEMGSLNEVNGVNYADKLEAKAKDREQARIDWQAVEGIKDLKKGYISQVVKKLADLAIEHNAIIIFEDLNMRFKQIRGGIEKSVYQQLEKALIEKLNFLAEKGEKDPEQAGHLLKAYQLTSPFETFKDMGKQTGIIFYTQAEYTSITDSVSGFRKNIYISNSVSIEKIKNEIDKFQEIGWDEKLQSYYFKYDAKKFNKQEKEESKEWTIYANVPRIRREKENGYWICKPINLNEMLLQLFSAYGIEKNKDIKKQIKGKESKNELGEKEFDGKKRNFYKSLIYILNLILQVRNSFSEDENGKENYIDFIASPVYPFFATEAINKKGEKLSKANFDAFEKMFLRNTKDKEKIKKEFNGDANGALNIARKGIIILDKISKWHDKNEKLKKEGEKEKFYPDLFISYSEWDEATAKWAKENGIK